MDYVDLYLIHWPNNYQYESKRTPMHVLWAKLEKLVAKGLTRAIGLSNFNTQFVGDILTYAKVRPVVNQIQIYPCYAQSGFIKFLRKQGIVPVAYSPIGRPGATFGPLSHVNLREDPLIVSLAKKYKRTPVQILINWGISRGYAVIPKANSLSHQKDNFAAMSFRLAQKDVDAIIAKFHDGTRLYECPSDTEFGLFDWSGCHKTRPGQFNSE